MKFSNNLGINGVEVANFVIDDKLSIDALDDK